MFKLTAIFHITKWQNLPSILAEGGLWCDTAVASRPGLAQGIGYAGIKADRMRTVVPVGAMGGVVADYVPFYFAPRSPMLYVNYRGGVPSNPDGQTPIVHLVADAHDVESAGLPFVFTDGHAVMRFSRWFTDLSHVNEIDWDVLKARIWLDSEEDNDRRRRRQAEFLVHEFFPWDLVKEVVVINRAMAAQVEGCLPRHGSAARPVTVARRSSTWPEGWYY